jgi:hypothetical protein
MLATLLTPLHLLLVSMPLPSLDFAPKSILSYRSPLVAAQPSFPPITFTIMFILSLFKRQKMVFKPQGNPVV